MGNSKRFSVVTVAVDSVTQEQFRTMLEGTDYALTSTINDYAADTNDLALLEKLRRNPPHIFIIDFDTNPERARRTVAQIGETLPGSSIFAVSAQADPDQIINAMRRGCSEYLVKPLDKERFKKALDEYESHRREKTATSHHATIVTMLGVKGGVGVTTLAVHLATFAARLNNGKVLLIDQHPDLGDVCVYLGIPRHTYNFYELVANVHRLDQELLQGFVLKHESGLQILSAPDAFEPMKLSPGASIDAALESLRSMYDLIVIDCAPGLTRFNVACVEHCDKVSLVTTPEVPSVRNLSRYLEHLGRFNCPQEKVDIILNRDSKRNPISRDHVERAIKRPVTVAVPNDYNDLIEGINAGRPLSVNSDTELVRTVRNWAQQFIRTKEILAPPAPKKRFGILGL